MEYRLKTLHEEIERKHRGEKRILYVPYQTLTTALSPRIRATVDSPRIKYNIWRCYPRQSRAEFVRIEPIQFVLSSPLAPVPQLTLDLSPSVFPSVQSLVNIIRASATPRPEESANHLDRLTTLHQVVDSSASIFSEMSTSVHALSVVVESQCLDILRNQAKIAAAKEILCWTIQNVSRSLFIPASKSQDHITAVLQDLNDRFRDQVRILRRSSQS